MLLIDPTKLITADAKFQQRKVNYIEQIKQAGDGILQIGFPFQGQHLQLRNDTDRTNWLTALAGYQMQIALGKGEEEGAAFRTAENNIVTVSYIDAVMALGSMIAWAENLYRVSWAKQDAARLATNDAELHMISLTDGWLPVEEVDPV